MKRLLMLEKPVYKGCSNLAWVLLFRTTNKELQSHHFKEIRARTSVKHKEAAFSLL
jgi:hypothetical protein